jgi:DNA-binding winged helix-turn-helix (wHTH) protein
LREKLWSADTFVDFDHSLGTAIGKLRQALGDSAKRPLFIETRAWRNWLLDRPPVINSLAVLPLEVLRLSTSRRIGNAPATNLTLPLHLCSAGALPIQPKGHHRS